MVAQRQTLKEILNWKWDRKQQCSETKQTTKNHISNFQSRRDTQSPSTQLHFLLSLIISYWHRMKCNVCLSTNKWAVDFFAIRCKFQLIESRWFYKYLTIWKSRNEIKPTFACRVIRNCFNSYERNMFYSNHSPKSFHCHNFLLAFSQSPSDKNRFVSFSFSIHCRLMWTDLQQTYFN